MIYGWFELDGSNDYFKRPDDGTFSVNVNDFMIECWVKTTNYTPSISPGLICKGGVSPDYDGWEFYAIDSKTLTFRLDDGTTAIWSQSCGNPDVNDGEWHHVVLVIDRSDKAHIFMDSVDGSTPVDITSVTDSVDTTHDLIVGARGDPARKFLGDLSAPRIYNFGVDGLPADITDLIEYNFKNPGLVHSDLQPYLGESWEFERSPLQVGTIKYKYLESEGTPIYRGGVLLYESVDKLTHQFTSAEYLKALVENISYTFQDLNNELENIRFLRTLTLAFGEQLDGIGDLLGEARNGRDDNEYREGIYFKILVNTARGTPETAIIIAKIITNSTSVDYREIWPAKIRLCINGAVIPSNLHEVIENIIPCGVAVDSIVSTFGAIPEFRFKIEDGPQEGRGFTELNTTTGAIYWPGGRLGEAV